MTGKIVRCGRLFAFRCPKKWALLAPLGTPERKYCDTCKKSVFYVTTEAQMQLQAQRGNCVAFGPPLGSDPQPAPTPARSALARARRTPTKTIQTDVRVGLPAVRESELDEDRPDPGATDPE